jgi:hypothetical protein
MNRRSAMRYFLQALGQAGDRQTGVRKASYHLPSPPQTFMAHAPLEQFVEHILPAGEHDAILWRFFAASDGPAEIEIAVTATAANSRTLPRDFMIQPPKDENPEDLFLPDDAPFNKGRSGIAGG